MKKQRILSLLLSLVVVLGTFAQKTFTLSGVVKDTHGEPIFAAAVALKKCDVEENRVHTMAGTAYGELLQDKTFWDDKGNLYVACNTEREDATSYTQQVGNLLRINKGEFQFDPFGYQSGNRSSRHLYL